MITNENLATDTDYSVMEFPKFHTEEELKEAIIERLGEEDTIEISYFKDPGFYEAIIGMSHRNELIYDYDLMIKSLMDNEDMEESEAAEWIDYNTERTIPYMPGNKPIIMYHFI